MNKQTNYRTEKRERKVLIITVKAKKVVNLKRKGRGGKTLK